MYKKQGIFNFHKNILNTHLYKLGTTQRSVTKYISHCML